MSNTPIPEIRAVNPDGSYGEILPDWRTFEYLDDTMDVGSATIEYPDRGGLRKMLLDGQREFALLLDGREVDNGRFRIEGWSGNKASDTPGYVTWAGKTLIARLEQAIIQPVNGEAREDALTPEERDMFRNARQEWVQSQIRKWRKKFADAEKDKHPDDDRKNGRKADSRGRTRNKGRLQEMDGEDSGSAKVTKLQPVGGAEARPWLLEPWYWRQRFEADSDLQERLDTAPPPVPPTFQNVTPGDLVLTLFRQAKERGALEEIRIDFTRRRDSNGDPWVETLSKKPDVGSTLLELLRELAEDKIAEPRMRGRTLQLFNADYGAPGAATVLFARGKNIVDGPQEGTTEDLVTGVFAQSDTGVHGWVWDPRLVDEYGVLEGVYEAQGVQTWRQLRREAERYLRENGRQKHQTTFGITTLNEEGTRPYRDFRAGSWVNVAVDGGRPEQERVRAITMSWDENQTMSCGVTLNDRLYERDITNKRMLQKMTGRTTGSSAVSRTSAVSGARVSDDRAPTKPAAPSVSSRNGAIEVSYDWTDKDGYPAIWDQDTVEVHVSTEPDYQPDHTTRVARMTGAGNTVLTREPYDEPRYVRFVAVDQAGDRSEPSDIAEISAAPVEAVLDPDGPTIPPELIPGQGWEYEGGIAAEQITTGDLQAAVAVTGRLYALDRDDPLSARLEFTPTGGLAQWIPRLDDQGNVIYQQAMNGGEPKPSLQRSFSLPTNTLSERDDGTYEQVSAIITGVVDAVSITSRKRIRADGDLDIPPGAQVRLATGPSDPVDQVTISSYTKDWYEYPGSPDGQTVIGMTESDAGNLLRCSKYTDGGEDRLVIDEIDYDTAAIVSTFTFPGTIANIGGWTYTGGYHYLLARGAADIWRIRQHGQDGIFTGVNTIVDDQMPYDNGALGTANQTGMVAFAYVNSAGNISVRYFGLDLNFHPTQGNTYPGISYGRSVVGVPLIDTVVTDGDVFYFPGGSYDSDRTRYTPYADAAMWRPGVGVVYIRNQWYNICNEANPTPTTVYATYTYYSDEGEETGMAPVVSGVMRAGAFVTLLAQSTLPSGVDGVYHYLGVSNDRTAMYRVASDDDVYWNAPDIPEVPTSGPVPPAESTFADSQTTPGRVQGRKLISGSGNNSPELMIQSVGPQNIVGLVSWAALVEGTTHDTLSSNTWHDIYWGTQIREDVLGVKWFGANEIEIGMEGRWLINAQISMASGSGWRRLGIKKNGVNVATGISTAAGGYATSVQITKVMDLDVDDRIVLQLWHNNGSDLGIRNPNDEQWLDVVRLSSAQETADLY